MLIAANSLSLSVSLLTHKHSDTNKQTNQMSLKSKIEELGQGVGEATPPFLRRSLWSKPQNKWNQNRGN